MEPGTHELKLFGDLLAGPGLRAFGHHLGSEAGQSGPVFRVGGGPSRNVQTEGHYGKVALLDDGDSQAVGKGAPLGNGRSEAGIPARWGHDGAVNAGYGWGVGVLGADLHTDLAVVKSPLTGTEDVLALDRKIVVDAGVDEVGVAHEGVEVVQGVGLSSESADPGQLPVVLGFEAVLGPGDLFIRGRVVPDAFQLGVDGLLDLLQGVAGGGGAFYDELPGYFGTTEAGTDSLGNLLFVDQGTIKAGAESVGQDSPQQFQGGVVFAEVGRSGPGDVEAGQGNTVAHFQFNPSGQTGIEAGGTPDLGSRREVAEEVVD